MASGHRPSGAAATLVLDEGGRGDLGVVRALGSAGVEVHIASSNPASATHASRFVSRIHALPPFSAPAPERLARLTEIARSIGGRPTIMMAGDGGLELVSEGRDLLGDVLRHDLAPREVVATCFHKDRFAHAAERLGLPVPPTAVPDTYDDVRRLAPSLTYPVFVKPRTKEEWGELPEGVVEATKGQRIDSAVELTALFARLAEHGADRALIQPYVASPDSEHYSVHAYVLPDGRFAGAFTTRKIRVWPPHRGIGSLVVSERLPDLVELSRVILERLEYRGTALLQFKRDLRDGSYLLLEINCRYSTSIELPVRCGMNLPAFAHATMTGGELPVLGQRVGVAWLDLERDLAAMREYRQLGEWTWGGYLASLNSVRFGAFFRVDDPGPWLRRTGQRIRRRFRRVMARGATSTDAGPDVAPTPHIPDDRAVGRRAEPRDGPS